MMMMLLLLLLSKNRSKPSTGTFIANPAEHHNKKHTKRASRFLSHDSLRFFGRMIRDDFIDFLWIFPMQRTIQIWICPIFSGSSHRSSPVNFKFTAFGTSPEISEKIQPLLGGHPG